MLYQHPESRWNSPPLWRQNLNRAELGATCGLAPWGRNQFGAISTGLVEIIPQFKQIKSDQISLLNSELREGWHSGLWVLLPLTNQLRYFGGSFLGKYIRRDITQKISSPISTMTGSAKGIEQSGPTGWSSLILFAAAHQHEG
jgi:hypothetical protein